MASVPQSDNSLGEYIQRETSTQLEQDRVEVLSGWCEAGHRALARGDYDHVLAITAARMLPEVDVQVSDIRSYGDRLSEHGEEFEFNAYITRRVVAGLQKAERPSTKSRIRAVRNSIHDTDDTIESLFRSVYSMLVVDGLVDGDATSEVPAFEYEHQVGVRYYNPKSSGSEPVQMIDPAGENKATLLTGGQGSGKSTAMETLIEDRIDRGHKVIDLIDFMKAENAMYDVPAADDNLRRIRGEMGLDVGFEKHDPPDVEIIAPLTPSLADRKVPFKEDTGEPIVRPFVIPAAELSYRQLVMVLPHTTPTIENYLKSAYQTLSNRNDNYTLAGMARCVREETNAGDAIADRIERSLETVQQQSFIRDHNAPEEYIIDWDSMMRNTDTITCFTQSTLNETSEKKLIASYLIDQLYSARRDLLNNYQLHAVPAVTIAMRELHKIVPKSNSEQDAESKMEKYMTDTMEDLIALVRHADIELIADTQKFKRQIEDDVAGLFHRIFAFGGQKPDIKEVFKTRVDNTDPASKVAKFEAGKCALVSGDGYTMPIQMAPPRCHHLDAKSDGNGLGFRTRHPDLNETLEPAPWNADIPNRLQFGMASKSPVARFWEDAITETGDHSDFVLKEDVTNAYSKWSDVNGEDARSHDRLHGWITRNKEVEDGKTTKHGRGNDRRPCYWGLEIQF